MKSICVPVDLPASARLDTNNCYEGDLIELDLSDEKFNQIYATGIFDSINKLAKSNIDDFEDEVIDNEQVLRLIINSGLLDEENYSREISEEIILIRKMHFEALNRGTGIYFFF